MDADDPEQIPSDSPTPVVPQPSQPTSQSPGVVGNQQPAAAPVSPSTPPKRKGKKVLIVILVLIIVAGGAALAYLHFHKAKAAQPSTTSTQKTPATQPPATPTFASALVFQPSVTSGNSRTTILNLDGSKTDSFSSTPSDATYNASGFSQENSLMVEGSALLTSDKAYKTYAVVTHDGKSHPVAKSLIPLLSANTLPNSTTTLSDGITIGSNTLIALENTPSNSKFVKINLTTGTVTNLFTAVSTAKQVSPGISPIQLITTSRDGTTAYFITDSVKVNSTVAPNVSLVTVKLSDGKFTVKEILNAVSSSAAVSKDGKYVAYISGSDNKGYDHETTHIYNVQTGKDVAVSSEGLSISAGGQDVRFSPDGAYLSVVGTYAADTKRDGMAMQIISVSTDTVVQQVNKEGTQYEGDGITGFGWAGDHNMIYGVNKCDNGPCNPDQKTIHSMDASTGKTIDYPATGELVAVLNYQQ